MEKTDCIIIGAGAIGLAIAAELAGAHREVVVLEKEENFGRATSSRNSEVIHGGMYYPQNTLKTRFCVEGNRLLYDFCKKHDVPFAGVGKLIIAAYADEVPQIEELYENGLRNGVPGLSLLDEKEIQIREPGVKAVTALLSETTGIFNTHRYMGTLEGIAGQKGALFAYGCCVMGITKVNNGYRVEFIDTDGAVEVIECGLLINSAGLYSDKIAEFAGIDITAAGYVLHHSKGEYFSVKGMTKEATRHLIYPVPRKTSLGIHTVLDLQGQLKLGPNAFYIDEIDYTVDETHSRDFYESAHPYLPALRPENLFPDMAGIRPKLQAPGDEFKDFVIQEESSRGLAGLINLIGIESPGLTASLAIGRYVKGLVEV